MHALEVLMFTVVLIHGLDSPWHGAVLRPLQFYLEHMGYDVVRASHSSGPTIADTISEVRAQLPEGDLVLIGHSLGGVIAADLAELEGARVRHIVCIASPVNGASLATSWVGRTLGRGRQIVAELADAVGPPPCNYTTLSGAWWPSTFDGRVWANETHWDVSRHTFLGFGHTFLVWHPTVWHKIVDVLKHCGKVV